VQISEQSSEFNGSDGRARLLPFDRAKQNRDVAGIKRDDNGSERAGFDFAAFGADENRVASDPDDGFAGSEIGDDLLVAGLGGGRRSADRGASDA